jgi:hypothetical protein
MFLVNHGRHRQKEITLGQFCNLAKGAYPSTSAEDQTSVIYSQTSYLKLNALQFN